MGIYALNKNHVALKHYAAPVDQSIPQIHKPSKTQTVVTKVRALSKRSLIFMLSSLALFVSTLLLLIAMRANFVVQTKDLENLQLQLSEIQEDKMHAEQEVNELSNYDRVIKIAEDNGLEVHEDNIRNVNR
ncbi:MAG: hypothetical protein MR008_03065 [Aerococcus sp.]|nr:hypothetical protein [Aerococcus sp.]